jgi:hypothetical protein
MPDTLVAVLARSLLAGEQTAEAAVDRAARTLGRRWGWMRRVAVRYIEAFQNTRPAQRDVVEFLRRDGGFARARGRLGAAITIAEWIAEPSAMRPVAAASSWNIPAIESPAALADWLCLAPGELDWYADLKGLCGKCHAPRLQHYRYRPLIKRSGGLRLIEAPKANLKAMQQRILAGILDRIPAHPAAHGFLRRRSIRSFAAPHVGQRVVLRMDLRDFFPGFRAARIHALFRTMGYPDAVAALLAGICTNAAPRGLWKELPAGIGGRELHEARILYGRGHLPQGAPTSPALANLCAYRVDCRLCGFAERCGAVYTRYADDLAFSGGEDFERRVERFSIEAAAILHEEGFAVNHRKTRIMRQGVRQHLAGVVVNQRVNVRRADFDRLKATLTNCVRLGPETQNREGHAQFRQHLQGRVAFVESIHRAKGARLREMLQRIEWPPGGETA